MGAGRQWGPIAGTLLQGREAESGAKGQPVGSGGEGVPGPQMLWAEA